MVDDVVLPSVWVALCRQESPYLPYLVLYDLVAGLGHPPRTVTGTGALPGLDDAWPGRASSYTATQSSKRMDNPFVSQALYAAVRMKEYAESFPWENPTMSRRVAERIGQCLKNAGQDLVPDDHAISVHDAMHHMFGRFWDDTAGPSDQGDVLGRWASFGCSWTDVRHAMTWVLRYDATGLLGFTQHQARDASSMTPSLQRLVDYWAQNSGQFPIVPVGVIKGALLESSEVLQRAVKSACDSVGPRSTTVLAEIEPRAAALAGASNSLRHDLLVWSASPWTGNERLSKMRESFAVVRGSTSLPSWPTYHYDPAIGSRLKAGPSEFMACWHSRRDPAGMLGLAMSDDPCWIWTASSVMEAAACVEWEVAWKAHDPSDLESGHLGLPPPACLEHTLSNVSRSVEVLAAVSAGSARLLDACRRWREVCRIKNVPEAEFIWG